MFNFLAKQPAPNDVLATGVGMVTPLAIGRQESWRRLTIGDTAGRSLTPHEVPHFDELTALLKSPPAGASVDHGELSQMVTERLGKESPDLCGTFRREFQHDCLNNLITFSFLEAIQDANLSARDLGRERIGCVIGTSKASLRAMEREFAHFRSVHSSDNASPAAVSRWTNAFMPDAPLRCIRFLTQAEGPSGCPVAACATGLISVIEAAQYIRSGLCDVCIAGSADASLRPSVLAAFHRLGVLSKHSAAATACRPFDLDRDGFVIGEGAAVMVLESRRHAEMRGATSYGQIVRGGWLTDPTGMTQIDSHGTIVSKLIDRVLGDCADPHHIQLHGTGTETNDLAESGGVRRAFGEDTPVCSAAKGAIGHLLGAAGSVEMAFTLLSLRTQLVPVTTNHGISDPACPVPLLTDASEGRVVDSALKMSLGFGGHVAACLVRR